jgi:hypothetical protein
MSLWYKEKLFDDENKLRHPTYTHIQKKRKRSSTIELKKKKEEEEEELVC